MQDAAVADLAKLAVNLEAAGNGQADTLAANLIEQAARDVQTIARQRAPKKTGALADSIVITHTNALRAVIGPTRKYGVFQEFGTGSRGEMGGSSYVIRPKRAARLRFQVNGQWVSAKEVNHPGIKPHPFMRPATADAIEGIQTKLGTAGATMAVNGRA